MYGDGPRTIVRTLDTKRYMPGKVYRANSSAKYPVYEARVPLHSL